jgi:hypothetical protein
MCSPLSTINTQIQNMCPNAYSCIEFPVKFFMTTERYTSSPRFAFSLVTSRTIDPLPPRRPGHGWSCCDALSRCRLHLRLLCGCSSMLQVLTFVWRQIGWWCRQLLLYLCSFSLFIIVASCDDMICYYWLIAIGNWKLVTGNWKLEPGNWVLETGFWNLETGKWLLATGYWKLTSKNWILDLETWNLKLET